MYLRRSFLTTAIALGLLWLGGSPAALACKALGPNKHVGVVQAINTQLKTFSIKDAESGMEMTFEASPQLLERVKVNTQVIVTYGAEGERLKAQAIQS